MKTSNIFLIKMLAVFGVLGILLAAFSGCAQKKERLSGMYITTKCYYLDPDSVSEEERESIERYKVAFQIYEAGGYLYCDLYSGEWIDEDAAAEGIYEWERGGGGQYYQGENGAVVLGSLRGKLEYKSGGRIFFYIQDKMGVVMVLKKSDLTPYDLIKSYEDWRKESPVEAE